MKYLIKHRIEFIITIVWFVILAYVLYDGFKNGREVQGILESVFGVTVWYKNIPTSLENSEHTGAMRLEKEQNKGIITGEDFMDEGAPEEEE